MVRASSRKEYGEVRLLNLTGHALWARGTGSLGEHQVLNMCKVWI